MKLKLLLFILLFAKIAFSQEPGVIDKISERVVIGFPGVSIDQLNLIKTEFLKHDQVISAKFIFEDHNCMLVKFNSNIKQFTVYAELLKTIGSIYEVNKCYIKADEAYDEISANHNKDSEFTVK